MTRLSFDRYCAEIVAQTDLLRSSIKDADLTIEIIGDAGLLDFWLDRVGFG